MTGLAHKVVAVLRDNPDGATLTEIGQAVRKKDATVLQHSIRSAVYRNLGASGKRVFRRE